ncbi:MAG: class I SAM-dependent methyltransferase [SAR324 cluster bacterium]|nr:class I SAM-dependent methyltransferase [SAR324 cluster bacterium]
MVIALVSIVITSVKVGISPMPSTSKACHAMISFPELSNEGGPIFELGSGWGTLSYAFSKKFPHRKIMAYELSWIPFLFSVILKTLCRLDNLSIYHSDFLKADLSKATVLVCYLFPNGMLALKNKLDREDLKINFIVSNTFALPDSQPKKVIQLNDFYLTPIYLYSFNTGDTIPN